MAAAGGYAFGVDFARIHINGAFYLYGPTFEEPRKEFFERRNEEVGDLFKVHGAFDEQAAYGRGDGSVLKTNCGFTPEQRMATTYGRKTNDWKKTNEVKELFEGMAVAKAAGTTALRDYLNRNFDVPTMLSYVAVRNWNGAWDDMVHNHYVYRRPNGKWLYMPWDFDQDFGGSPYQPFGGAHVKATDSFYISLDLLPQGGQELTKAAFMTAFKTEYDQKLRDLSKTALAPANVNKAVDDYLTAFSLDDWKASPGRVMPDNIQSCDAPATAARIKKWATDRHAALVSKLGQ